MYRSPIEILMTDIQHQIAEQQDEQIYKAVVSVGINVDKEELIRALAYDRQQYAFGYMDGTRDSKPRWIPVEERLPEDNERILILSLLSNHYVAQHFRGHFYVDGTHISTSHWMPLPEPPKGE